MRRTYFGPTAKGYSGRSEYSDIPEGKDLRKLPALRLELKAAADKGQLSAIAAEAGCSTQHLKQLMKGDISKPYSGVRSRLITALAPARD